MKSIQPVGQKILVEPINAKEEKLGNVVIAASANAEVAKGIVRGISQQFQSVYKLGDEVLFIAKAGISCIHQNKPHILLDAGSNLHSGDLLAIVTEVAE